MYQSALEQQKAFTLIELMIVLAIIGILGGIAYPSYQSSVIKSRRADAKGALLNFANAMERHFTVNNTYQGAAGSSGSPSNTGSPWIIDSDVPADGTGPNFTLNISAADATSYTLQAIPAAIQADDPCGTLTLDQTAQKGIVNHEPGRTVADCW